VQSPEFKPQYCWKVGRETEREREKGEKRERRGGRERE
jgi:hypothetical protein